MDSVNSRLKRLREGARPPISGRALAEKVGLSKSAYHLYESDGPGSFKQRYLPMDLARRIAQVLADHGVNPDDVLALAGVGIDEASSHGLSAGEEQLLGRFRQLDDEQRTLLLQLADQLSHRESMMVGSTSNTRSGATVHAEQQSYRSGEAIG